MADICPTCATLLPADAPQGLCPACLMRVALAETHQQTVLLTPGDAGTTEVSEDWEATTAQLEALVAATEASWQTRLRETAEKWLAAHPNLTQQEINDRLTSICSKLKDEQNRVDAIRERLNSAPVTQRQRVEALFSRRLPDLELTGFVGAGGMGEVWLAEHRGLGREVAVKLLSEEVAQEPGFAERFRREARAMARLDHPQIVKIHDFGESAGVFFLVMEFHPGNLRERMSEGPVPLPEALDVMLPLCEAVSAVHGKGLVHRDLKPENVLLNHHGLKLADFGLARVGGEAASALTSRSRSGGHLTEAGGIVGTPAYMAPEQWQTPESVDARADVYALGLILAEMLTGELPRGRYTQPSEVCGDRHLDAIVARALQPDPVQRFQTAGELRDELEQVNQRLRSKAMAHSLRNVYTAGDLVKMFHVFVWIAGLTLFMLAGWSVACHTLFLLALAALWIAQNESFNTSWGRPLCAGIITAGVLLADILGPALGLPPFMSGSHWLTAIVETAAIVAVSGVASWLLTKHVNRLLGLVTFPVLLSLALAAFYVPVFRPLGLWMPFALAALNLSLLWAFEGARWREPALPVVEAPLVESPFAP